MFGLSGEFGSEFVKRKRVGCLLSRPYWGVCIRQLGWAISGGQEDLDNKVVSFFVLEPSLATFDS